MSVLNSMRDASCQVEFPRTAEESGVVNLFARVGVQPQARRCPVCESIIYSRRHKLCGVCCSELPESCLFTVGQAESVSSLLAEERARHRNWMRRVNADS